MVRPKDYSNIEKVADFFIDRYVDDGFVGYFSKSKLSRGIGINPKSLDWVLNFLIDKKFIEMKEFDGKEVFMLVK